MPVTEGGGVVRGELYDVPLEVLRDSFLPHEPAEPSSARWSSPTAARRCAWCCRPEEGPHPEITEHGGWRAYRAARG